MPSPNSQQLKKLLHDRKKLKLLISFHQRSLLTQTPDELLGVLIHEIKALLRCERVTLFLLDPAKEELFARVAMGLEARILPTLRFPISQGIAGYVARTGHTANVANAYRDPRFDPRFDELYHFETRSVLATPLKDPKGQIVGVLEIFNKVRGTRFDKQDEGLLMLIASQLTSTLENSRLLEELKRSNLEAIYILAQAAEYRDQEDTAKHLKRISDYSTILARSIGLSPEEVETIRFASPLHDIGKIAISDAILKKPGRFSPEEMKEMQKHTLLGYEMLKDAQSPMLKLAREIALTHHERYDGMGYPNKLKGEEIPLASRIVSLTDVFDALSAERVYKPPWPLEKVLEHIKSQAGKHFDPEIVDVFMSNLPKIEAIYLNSK